MIYSEEDILKLAKRFNNKKRNYLLVNPLQAKHIPVSPEGALAMMNSLGYIVSKKHSKANLVIGFAETATAIGAVVASYLGDSCTYIHTTREKFISNDACIEFCEEHSHATEQKLYSSNLSTYLNNTDEIILVDDELSTGKTLINIVEQLNKRFPEISRKHITAVSIINRLTNENVSRLKSYGIECEYLVKLPEIDYTKKVEDIPIKAPVDYFSDTIKIEEYTCVGISTKLADPRIGINIHEYIKICNIYAEEVLMKMMDKLLLTDDVLILGTEECMYPAIIFANILQKTNKVNTVKCHSTTRSPIGVYDDKDYPIKNGYKIHSFYDDDRETYIYDLEKYDKVIVITDTKASENNAMNNICTVLKLYGTNQLFYIKGECNVQHI